jgi:hypothetical protein
MPKKTKKKDAVPKWMVKRIEQVKFLREKCNYNSALLAHMLDSEVDKAYQKEGGE